jgi:hypothetical protein
MICRAGIAAFLVALAVPVAALATTPQGQATIRKWAGTDRCAQAAQKAFPDYTAESNAKREANLQQCLAGQNLPPRESVIPAAPAKP